MGAITGGEAKNWGFTLVDGPDNLVGIEQASTQNFIKGDLLKVSSGKVAAYAQHSTTGTSTTSAAIFAVAAGTGSNGSDNIKVPVYVISPDQTWEVHAQVDKQPSASFSRGDFYKLKFTAASDITFYHATGTSAAVGTADKTTTNAGLWYVSTGTATDGKGVKIIKYREFDDEHKTCGGRMLVRFGNQATA